MIGSMVKNHPKSFGIQNTTGMGTMKQNKTPLTLALTLAAVALSGCGGSSSSSNSTPTPQNQTLSGTAATGLAMAGGQVTVVNAAGKTASATVNAKSLFRGRLERIVRPRREDTLDFPVRLVRQPWT